MSKTRMGKRVASLLLSLVMMLSLLPTTVYAEGADTGATNDAVVGQATTSGTNTEEAGELESTGEGKDGSEAGNEGETSVTCVAQVGDVQYKTLEAAIGAAADGATVSLLDNVTLNTTLTVAKNITIDVGSFTLTVATDSDGIVVNNAALTLTGAGKYVFNCTAGGSDGIFVHNTGANTVSTLNLNGDVEITVNSNVNSAIHAYGEAGEAGSAVVNINQGTIKTRGEGTQSPAVIIDQNATLNMNGGTFDLNVDFDSYSQNNDVVGVLIWGQIGVQKNCAVNISGGTFKVGGKNAFAQAVQVGMKNGKSENCTVNISGGEVVLNPTENGKGYVFASWSEGYATASIIGGTVSGAVTALTVTSSNKENTSDLTISGGTFSTTLNVEKYLAEGKTLDESGNVVDKAPEVKPVTVNGVGYDTLEDAIDAATPDANGVITYEISGKVDVTATGWVQVAKAGLTDLTAVKFVGTTNDAAIYVTKEDAVLADQVYGNVDVSFSGLTLVKENPTYLNDYAEFTQYFAMEIRATVKTGVVAYTDCKFPEGVINNTYGKTVFTGCEFSNDDSRYNLWVKEGEVELNNGAFTGTRGVKLYNTGNAKATITIKDTTFDGLTGKAAIVVSQPAPADVTLENVTARNCTVGLIQKDTATDATIIKANGESISGTFNITNAGNAKNEFNISAGTFTSEVSNDYCTDGFEVKANDNGTYGVVEAATAAGNGTEANPYTLAELGAMTRAEYIAAQELLGGTMYVTVGNYSYDKNGTLGNGVRDDATGQTPDHSKLNAYGENGYLNEKNDGANGKNIVFVDGTITSGVTGYASIDNIGTSLLLAVPAYTKVTFKGITFNGVMSFNYQLYTSPWSQLGELKFDECTFNGIIVGAIAAQTLTFSGCTFANYTNTTDANSSNPTWIRPAYGNWTEGDNKGQGNDFRSLTTINFTGNTVTSTRPVKFEYISQWDIRSKVTATGNYFDISKQAGDEATKIKNVGLYLGAHTDANAFDLVAEGNTKSENTAALFTIPAGETSLPLGSTVKNSAGEQIVLEDALKWKAADEETGKIVLKTVEAVASVGDTKYASLTEAVAAAKADQTVTLLSDTTEDVTIDKNITLDLGGKTLTNTGAGKATISVTTGTVTVKGGSVMGGTSYYNIAVGTKTEPGGTLTLEGVTATAGNTGSSMIDNWGTLTINSGTYTGGLDTVKSEEGSTLTITGGTFTLDYATNGYTAVILVYGDTTITGGEFTQSLTTTGRWNHPQVIATGVVEGYTAITRVTGGRFVNKMSGEGIFRGVGKGTSDNFEVSGGTFNKAISDAFCADGFIPTKNADGTYGVKEGQYVAKVGDKKYETLADAIQLAASGKTVTLLADVTENVTIAAAKKNLTLDLNGYTLNGGTEKGKAALTNYGTIIIKDSSTARTGTIMREDKGTVDETSYYVIDNHGTMTITGSKVINNSGYRKTNPSGSMVGSSLIRNGGTDVGATLTITGGTFMQANFIAIKNDALGKLKVTGGTITSEHSAIQNWFEADITGGEITGQLWTDAYFEGESVGETTIGGDAKFTGEIVMDITGSVAPKLEITGGELNVTNWRITNAAAKAGAKPAVSGGTFNYEVPEDYCADGFIPTKNEDGSYGVKEGKYVAETNGVKYETLQAAIDAAKSGATVKMLADTKENVTIDKALTLDLNGHILNGGTVKATPALTITARTVTIKDSSEAQTGTIMREDTAENSGVSSHYVIDIQGNAWVMFESGIVKNNSGNAAGKGASLVRIGDDSVGQFPGLNIKGGTFTQDNFIVIKVDRGDLFLNGGTLNSASSYAVENWLRATIKGGTVNGAVSSWTYSSGSNSALEISGGTVNGNVESVSYDGAEGKLAKVKITGGTVNGTLSTKRYNNATAPSKDMATIEITGGTFSSDPSAYLVESSSVTKNSDGTFGVAKAYLATVDDASYYTMDEAFKAQTASGQPIVLLRDYTTGSTFNSGTVARVVDLDGHTWTCTGTDANSAAFEINNPNASLTVKNGKIVSSQLVGLIPSAMGGTITYDNSSLTFENVEMSTTATSGIETNGNNTNDSVTLKNSTLNVPNGFGIYFPSSGTLTIDNSTITAKTMGVQVCAGSLSINAGSAITVSGDAVPKTENDGAIQDGAAISIVNRTGYKGLGTVTVFGGKFTAKEGNSAIKAYNWADKTETDFTAKDKVAVSGGTFSSAVPEGLCAEGYVPTAVDADGNYTVELKKVAEYNGTKYETLQKAIDAASKQNYGQTEVKLLCNLTITETIVFAKQYSVGSVLLNLGGYTLTGNGCRALQINKGNLYLENGTVTSIGIIDSSSVIRIGSNEDAYSGVQPQLYMRNGAKVVAPDSYGVTLFGSKTVKEKLTVAGNASIEATGPSPAISGNGDKAYHVDGKGTEITITGNAVVSATNNYAIYHPDNGTLKIQDNASVSGKGGIQMCSGTLTISGSPKIEALGKADHETGAAGPIYDIAAISVVNRSYPGGAPVVTIKGTPTVTANEGEVIHAYTWSNNTESVWAKAGDNINVSGGTYNKQFNEAYLAADCTLVTNSEGGYTVEQKKVAEYNDTQYTSLAQAIRDANNAGGTVKLLDNVTLTSGLGIGGTAAVTLNLNKKTLTLNGAQIYTQGSATVTINNGTIKRTDVPTSGSANNFAIQVMSGSSLILGGGTGSTYKVTLESTYGIYNVGGTLNVRYATITTDGWSIAVSDSASKTGEVYIGRGMGGNTKTVITSESGNVLGTMVNSKPNVTIDYGTLTSNGTDWDAGVIYWASEGTLTITGGIFNASSVEGSTAAAVYQKNGTVKISGTTAKLLGSNALVAQVGAGSTGTMVTELSGGTYSTKPDEAWVVEGKEIHDTDDGMYKVEGPYLVEVTLEDGTVHKFDSWSKAFYSTEAQEHNATVKLLTDIETTSTVTTWATVTVDFNGHTLTVNGSGVAAITALTKGTAANVTLMDSVGNGGMVTTGVYGVTVKGSNTTLTVESGNYNCYTSVVQVEKPVSGVATAYIKGGTFQTEDAVKSYLLNCIDKAFKDGTAKMEVTGGTFYGFDPSANPEGENTTYVKAGYVSNDNGDGTYTVEEYKPVEVWTGYTGTKVASYATIKEAVANLGNNKWIVIAKDYTLDEDFTIPTGVFLDVASGATLTVAEGTTLTVAADAKRLGVRTGATLENNGTIMVLGTSGSNGYVMVQDDATFDVNTLSVREDHFLDNNGSNYFATANANALYEITYTDGTVKKTADSPQINAKTTQVKLLKDVEKGSWVLSQAADNFILDLGGKTLSGSSTSSYYLLYTGVNMTIKNGTIKYNASNKGAICVYNGATVTIDSTATIDGGSGIGIMMQGETPSHVVLNGTVKTTGEYGFASNGSENADGKPDTCNITVSAGAKIEAPNGFAIYHPTLGTVTINGGEISGHTGIEMCAGKLVVSGGSITSTGDNWNATGSQNAILDGAAISLINRNYPGGTPTAEITGGTFTATGNGAQTVKAYDYTGNVYGDWTDVAKYVNISSGTFSSIPSNMAALYADGYRAVENGDGSYTVKKADIAIQVTSRIKDDGDTTVSTTTGGGMYCKGEKVTVTTSNVIGFEFLGWYKMDSYNGAALFTGLSYTFTASEECTLVALYSPAGNATLTVKVTASAFKITGSKWVQNNGGMYKLPVGSSVTVTYTDDTYAFLYWVNGSDKIVSTNSEYTFTLGSNTELRACTSPKGTEPTNAMVVFKTAYDQVLTAQRYGNDEEIVFPMGPSKTGYKFIGWSMTQAEIRDAMAKNDYIVVTPEYETLGTKYTVTVKYAGIEKAEDTHTINVGDSILLTAAETEGEKTFSYWMIDDQIVSYLTTLTVFESKDVTVTAVYGVEANAKAKIRISDVSATQDGLYYLVTFTQAFALPEDATLVLTGFIRADDEESAANMNINRYSKIYKSSLTTNDGTYYQTIASKNADKTYYMMAFVQYKDAKGDLQTVYSECVQASYASLKGGN